MKRGVFIFLLLPLSSCLDFTKGMPDTCELHKAKMAKVVKKVHYGYNTNMCYSEKAPNGSPYECPGCNIMLEKLAIGFRCVECKKIWLIQKKSQKKFDREFRQ